jgi:YHS domain-containing protein
VASNTQAEYPGRMKSYICPDVGIVGDSNMAVDPICKMNVSESQAKYTSVRNGTKYYFCSAACKQEFDKNPTKYS